MKFEVVEYRSCDCGDELCRGFRETVHFEHEAIEECQRFMLMFPDKINAPVKIFHPIDDKNKMNIEVTLPSGLVATRKFKIQELK